MAGQLLTHKLWRQAVCAVIYYPPQGARWIASHYGSVLVNTAQMNAQGKSRTFDSPPAIIAASMPLAGVRHGRRNDGCSKVGPCCNDSKEVII